MRRVHGNAAPRGARSSRAGLFVCDGRCLAPPGRGRPGERCCGAQANARGRAERQALGGRSIRAGRPEVMRQESGGGRRVPAVIGRRDEDGEERRGPGVRAGRRRGREAGVAAGCLAEAGAGALARLATRRAGGALPARAVGSPRGGRSSRNRPGNARRTCNPGRGIRRRNGASSVESPRATSPRPQSATANASSRLLRSVRVCDRDGLHAGGSGRGASVRRVRPGMIRSASWSGSGEPCQGVARIRESASEGQIRPVVGPRVSEYSTLRSDGARVLFPRR